MDSSDASQLWDSARTDPEFSRLRPSSRSGSRTKVLISTESAKMNRHIYIMKNVIWTIFLGLTACSNHRTDESRADKSIANSSSVASQQTKAVATDSSTMQQNELTKIYTQAIAEFIKICYKKDKTTFDPLYFGKHIYGQPDDFPDIELPEIIEKTQIRLVTPEVGEKKQAARKSLVYVNLIGWVDKDKADFIFVVFTNGGKHQYDYFINFSYNSSLGKFELDKIEFENYLNLVEQKPKRTTIFQNGKYVVDN